MWLRKTTPILLMLVLTALLAVGGLGLESRLRPAACWPYGDRSLEVSTLHVGPGVTDVDELVPALREVYPGQPVFRMDWEEETVLAVGSETGAPDLRAARETLASHGVLDARTGGGTYYQSAPDWFSRERLGHDLAFAGVALVLSASLVGWRSSRRRHSR